MPKILCPLLLVLAALLSAPASRAATAAAADPSAMQAGTPWPDACLTPVWSPDEDKIARWFASPRVRPGTAPDGSRAVEITAQGGQPNPIAQILAPAGGLKAEAARISVEMLLEPDYAFNPQGSAKFPLGLWGGEKGCLSGGCGASRQTGFSVRLTHRQGGDRAAPSLYSYHLNRAGDRSDQAYGKGLPLDGLSGAPVQVPTGRWVRFVLDVVLNHPDREDGWVRALMLVDGRPVAARQTGGLRFRDRADWRIRGPILTDMWGGDIKRPANFPPRTERAWYRGFRIAVPENRCAGTPGFLQKD